MRLTTFSLVFFNELTDGPCSLNGVLDVEITAASTPYAAGEESIDAVETLVDGDSWMVYENSETGVVHWDTSVVPRFIMFPVIDGQ